jgi:hypothetical protein
MSARPTVIRRTRAALANLGLGWAVALGTLPGCLNVPAEPAPMCHTTSDCTEGEVCEEGVCWGNPPPGPFAAVLSPPSSRRDLAPAELAVIEIPQIGWLGDLALEKPALVTGRLVELCPPPMTGCDTTSLGATVIATRSSRFQGGPGFKAFVNVEPGADSFSLALPRTQPGDPAYSFTIVPEGGQLPSNGRSAAERMPPLRLRIAVGDAPPLRTIELGGADLPVIRGTLTNGLGQGLNGYRVVALGRWDTASSPTEVSSVDFTDANGGYAVTLSDGLVGTVELIARPPRGTVAATIHVPNLDANASTIKTFREPATLGNPFQRVVVVTGVDRSGAVSPVSGATVSVSGASSSGPELYTVNDERITNDAGMVTLDLIDGSAVLDSYRLSVAPPAGSSLGVLFDQRLPPADDRPLRLPARAAMRGRILDSDGNPLGNAAVTARPSLRFLWTLEAAPQAFVATIPAAAAVTTDDGAFVLWVDPSVAQVPSSYDLLIEPSGKAQAASVVKSEIATRFDVALDAASLGDVQLPDAAFVHGRIVGPDGTEVSGAELKLFRVNTVFALCTEVSHAPSSCPIPAVLQGRGTSDAAGTVRVALPR